MRAIKIIDTLRDTWEHRKGKPAPKNILNEDVAFYRFVDAVFTAVGLNRDVRGTMQAWLKFKKKYPDALRSGSRTTSRSLRPTRARRRSRTTPRCRRVP